MGSTATFGAPIENHDTVGRKRKRADPDDTNNEKTAVIYSPQKRVKKAGKLARIMEISLDVIFEVSPILWTPKNLTSQPIPDLRTPSAP
jgi:hypothetical protein